MTSLSLFLVFSSLAFRVSYGENVVYIHNASDLIEFSNNVENETSYNGTTVYLDSDIYFSDEESQEFEPIGKDTTNYFLGTFNGQGHTINGLTLDISAYTTSGIFGFSRGMIIENVVISKSCSFKNNYTKSGGVVEHGSIIGGCSSWKSKCTISNIVNMASVSFTGSIYSIKMGGICGQMSGTDYGTLVMNCVNYGSVSSPGTVTTFVHLGGIIGDSDNGNKYIYNCLNYGSVALKSTSNSVDLWIGGILGESIVGNLTIKNCVNGGTLYSKDNKTIIGNILGRTTLKGDISYGYWESGTGSNKCYGWTNNTVTTSNTGEISNYNDVISKLNSQASSNSWNRWLANTNEKKVNFTLNKGEEGGGSYVVSSKVVLHPDLKSCGTLKFAGLFADDWYYPEEKPSSVNEDATYYSLYGAIILANFDANGGSTPKAGKYSFPGWEYGELPTPTRAGYSFDGWYTAKSGGEKVMPSAKIVSQSENTIYAHWTANSYKVTFNANGGDGLVEGEVIVVFNETYKALPELTRDGYMFLGWFTEDNKKITNETISSIPENYTLHAEWSEKTAQVQIVFETKELTQKEIEKIIEKYTDEEFTIIRFEESESGEIRAIIKFKDIERAESFIETIKTSSEAGNGLIKEIVYSNYLPSLSSMNSPSFFVMLVVSAICAGLLL